MRFKEYVAIENPSVKTVSRQPSIIASGDVIHVFKNFVHDTPELVYGAVAWLTRYDCYEVFDRSVHPGESVCRRSYEAKGSVSC